MCRRCEVEGLIADQDERSEVVLSVIIATYNGRELLATCVDSLCENPPTVNFEIIVVDDASSDGSYEMMHERFPFVRLLRNETNVHYGRSNNRALNIARGRYVYLLNNDTVVLPGSLDAMVTFLATHPDAGSVGSKLLNPDGSIQWSVKSLPNPGSALFGARSFITRLFPSNVFSRKHLLHLSADMSGPFIAPYVSSASIMMPRRVVNWVGGLDERLSYHVDADYCKRITDAGWNNYYLPSATVIHLDHKGGTMVNWKRRFRSVVEFHRGSYLYYQKHIQHSRWEPMHLAVILGLGARFVASLLLQVGREAATQMKKLRGGRSDAAGFQMKAD
jgi:GT2 family glycosyltransferase